MQSLLDQAKVHGMEQIDDSVYYDSKGKDDDNDEDDDNTFHVAIQVEDVIDDNKDDDTAINGETINNDVIVQVGTEDRATGVTIKYEVVLHAQYCHFSELYYQSCKIYG